MAKRRGMKGEGIVGNHTTVIEPAKDILHFIGGLNNTKIAPGIITQANRKASIAIKLTPTKTGLEMKVMGNRTIQSFYIYTANPEYVIESVEKKFPGLMKK